jgi:hypothetical protein
MAVTRQRGLPVTSRHRRTYRQEPGHKGGVGGALTEARHRRREDAPGGRGTCVPAELPGVVLSAFEHRLDRTAEPISRSSAPRSRTAYRTDTACREPSSWYTKRAISARCGTVTRGVLRPCRGRDPPRGGQLRGARWCRMSVGRPNGGIA